MLLLRVHPARRTQRGYNVLQPTDEQERSAASAEMETGWPFGNRPVPRKMWSVRRSGRPAECEINAHPLRHEVRFYERGDLTLSQVLPTSQLAEAEADQQNQDLITQGWTDRPKMPL